MRGCLMRIINTIFALVITVVVLAGALVLALRPRPVPVDFATGKARLDLKP